MKIRNILFPICLIYLLSHIYLYAEDDFIIIQPEPDPIIDIPSDQPDTTPPTGSIVINNGNPEITYSENVILYLTCNDEGSGVDKVRYSNDAVTWTPWEVPVSTKEWTLTSENGTKTVYYEIKDAAGNTTQLNDTINLGITFPTGSIVINSDNPDYSHSENAILYLTYNDEGSGVDKVRYSNDTVTWTPWEVPVSTKEWTLTSENGTKTVYYEIKNIAGNITQLDDTIILDTIFPTGSIVINNGNPDSTYSGSVTLYLTYNDEGSGVDKVRYSNDETTWTSWEAPAPTKEWTLTADNGAKTVYYEISDMAGNVVQIEDSIILTPDTLSVNIDINPKTLILKEWNIFKEKFITVYIELPAGFDVNTIDIPTVNISVDDQELEPIFAEKEPVKISDYDLDGIPDLMLKFDRIALEEVLSPADEVKITISGSLNDQREFIGDDTIKVIESKWFKWIKKFYSPPISATVDIKPDTLDFKDRQKYITASIELPVEFDVSKINTKSIRISEINGRRTWFLFAKKHSSSIGDSDGDGTPDLTVDFGSLSLLQIMLSRSDKIKITIIGFLNNGKRFAGNDTITISKPIKKFRHIIPSKCSTLVKTNNSSKNISSKVPLPGPVKNKQDIIEKLVRFNLAKKLASGVRIKKALLYLGSYNEKSIQNLLKNSEYDLDVTDEIKTSWSNGETDVKLLVKFDKENTNCILAVILETSQAPEKEETISFKGGEIVIPPGINKKIIIKKESKPKECPQDLKSVSEVFTSVEKTELDTPVKITLFYDEDKLQDSDEENLRIYLLNEDTLRWQEAPNCKVDTVKNNISVETTMLNSFCIMTAVKPASPPSEFVPGEVYSYPNPVRYSQSATNPTIHFECGIADKIEINIYNIAAELIDTVEIAGSGSQVVNGKYCYEYKWNIDDIPSGIYIYTIKATKDTETIKAMGKCAIIK